MRDNKLYIFLFILIISLGIIGYFGYQNHLLLENKLALEGEISRAKENINSLQKELETTKGDRDDFETKYNEEKERMDYFSSQIEGIQGTVGTLEKLSQTDPKLLKKYLGFPQKPLDYTGISEYVYW